MDIWLLTFVLICFSLMGFYSGKWRWLLVIPLSFGLFSMGIANSRSPFVALFAILGIFCFMRINLKTILGICIVALLLILNIGHIDLFFRNI